MEKRWPNNVHKWPQSNTFLANLRDPYNWGTLAYFDVSPFFVLSSMDKFVIAYMNTFNILMFGPPLIFLQIDVQSNLFSLVKVLHLHYYIGIKTPYPCLLMLKLMTHLDQAKRWRVKFQYISLIKAKLWTLCTFSSAYIHNHLHNQRPRSTHITPNSWAQLHFPPSRNKRYSVGLPCCRNCCGCTSMSRTAIRQGQRSPISLHPITFHSNFFILSKICVQKP